MENENNKLNQIEPKNSDNITTKEGDSAPTNTVKLNDDDNTQENSNTENKTLSIVKNNSEENKIEAGPQNGDNVMGSPHRNTVENKPKLTEPEIVGYTEKEEYLIKYKN